MHRSNCTAAVISVTVIRRKNKITKGVSVHISKDFIPLSGVMHLESLGIKYYTGMTFFQLAGIFDYEGSSTTARVDPSNNSKKQAILLNLLWMPKKSISLTKRHRLQSQTSL